MQGLGELVSGTDHGETWYRRTEEQRRWLDTGLYLNGTGAHCLYLIDRGYAQEALSLHQHGMSMVAENELPAGITHRSVEIMARALLGEATDAVALLQEQRQHGSDDPARLVSVVHAAVQCAYEQGDLNDRFEQAIADFARSRVRTSSLYPPARSYFAYVAYGRLAQCVEATTRAPDGLPARLAAAENAVKDLGRAANRDLLRGHHAVARAQPAPTARQGTAGARCAGEGGTIDLRVGRTSHQL